MKKKEFKKGFYPNDGGLKEPVREFRDTYSVVDVIKKHFSK